MSRHATSALSARLPALVSRRDFDEFSFAVSGEREARADVLVREVGKIGDDLVGGHSGGKILQHVIDRDAEAAVRQLGFFRVG